MPVPVAEDMASAAFAPAIRDPTDNVEVGVARSLSAKELAVEASTAVRQMHRPEVIVPAESFCFPIVHSHWLLRDQMLPVERERAETGDGD
ncbi:hypothetical protein [Breoghania sp.]|uniref:hypothetical protein n=1 Tax=Breoghania sp. TaxID=2065378 RepID=UPI002AA84404|nr:hypothetical protein [Breoghania sp.]